MTEQTQFFFDCIENSTELYREAQTSQQFYLRSFLQEPTSNEIFLEVEVSSEAQDSLFRFQQTFEFPNQIKDKFIRLVSQSSQRSQINESSKKETKTKTIEKKKIQMKRIKRTKRMRKVKKGQMNKVLAKSEITKNACCNIVQKAISLIKKGEFDQKMDVLCTKFQVETEAFKMYILNEKSRFTGTKALEKFLNEATPNRRIFTEFLSWFLREKYIRYAIKSGEMSDMAAYIKFKNEVILPLL